MIYTQNFQYEIKNEKLKLLVEKRANELDISVGKLIWTYVNRCLFADSFDEESMAFCHSDEFLNMVNNALNVD